MRNERYFENANDFIENEKNITLEDVWVFEGVDTEEKAANLMTEFVKSSKPNWFKDTIECNDESPEKYAHELLNGVEDTSLIWADGPYATFEKGNLRIDFSPIA